MIHARSLLRIGQHHLPDRCHRLRKHLTPRHLQMRLLTLPPSHEPKSNRLAALDIGIIHRLDHPSFGNAARPVGLAHPVGILHAQLGQVLGLSLQVGFLLLGCRGREVEEGDFGYGRFGAGSVGRVRFEVDVDHAGGGGGVEEGGEGGGKFFVRRAGHEGLVRADRVPVCKEGGNIPVSVRSVERADMIWRAWFSCLPTHITTWFSFSS